MRTIGMIGGLSWESTAEYYRLINTGIRHRLGPLRSASLLIRSVDFGPVELAQREGRWDDAAEILASAGSSLEAGGAECVVLCTNTMHKVASQIEQAIAIPFLHIADPVGAAAVRQTWNTVGLLGTAFTMEQSFLKDRLSSIYGLTVVIPPPEQRRDVHRIVYDELCSGVISDASRSLYRSIIDGLAAQGAPGCDPGLYRDHAVDQVVGLLTSDLGLDRPARQCRDRLRAQLAGVTRMA